MAVNLKRMLVGGLVAGVTVGVCGAGLVPIVGDEMHATLAPFQLPALSSGAMAYFGLVSLVIGLVLVWLYAALQPRMKPGPRTALVSAFVVWPVGNALPNFANIAYGFMPMRLTIIGTAWGLLELGTRSLVGARFYREAESR